MKCSTAIIGAGMSGIGTAYYLCRNHGISDVVLVEAGQPMGFTSAQSGENYRNWWPHPAMVALTNRSIDLMEEIAWASGNRINMTRRGYVLATRSRHIDPLLEALHRGLGEEASALIRVHDGPVPGTYRPPERADWQTAPIGVDVLRSPDLIRKTFPSYDPDIQSVIHIRRAGDISGQQLGGFMLEAVRAAGGRVVTGTVEAVSGTGPCSLEIATSQGRLKLAADKVVNAAGPFAGGIARLMGIDLPIRNVFQQKLAFEDREGAVPRALPFSIDMDRQIIDWSEEERSALREDPALGRFAEDMPGAIHCRPDGGDNGTWVKLGWAYNVTPEEPAWERPLDDTFPEIVLRGAARLQPALRAYYGQLPRNRHHYGGWYTMTEENWPLIGPMGIEGAFVNGAASGFGTMTACAGGELCAAWVAGGDLPGYAGVFSLARYEDEALMACLRELDRGVL